MWLVNRARLSFGIQSTNTTMKNFLPNILVSGRNTLLFLMLLGLPTFVFGQFPTIVSQFQRDQVQWENDLNRAAQLAKETNRLLFVHFYGDNCPPCKAMDAQVFTDQRIISEISRKFVAVRIDTAKNPALGAQFEVKAIPTDIILDEAGKVINRRQGGISADRFGQYLSYLQTLTGKTAVVAASEPALSQGSMSPNPFEVSTTASATSQAIQPVLPSTDQAPVGFDAMNSGQTVSLESPTAELANNVVRDPFTKQPLTKQPFQETASTIDPRIALPAQISPSPFNATASIPTQSPFAVTGVPSDQPQATERSNPVRTELSVSPAVPIAGTGPLAANPTTASQTTHPSEPAKEIVIPDVDCSATAQMVEVPLGLDGFCPVVLGQEERWTPGNPALYAMFRGQVYRFSSEDALTEFVTDPLKFAPIAMGEDIVLMVERNKKSYGSRRFGAWYEGRVFLFSCQETLDVFAAKPEYYSDIAQKYETAVKSQLNSVQR